MSRQEGINRHRFIIHKLRQKPCSFKEIHDFLQFQEEMLEEQFTCSIRTFQRDVKEIERIYQIKIKCDKSRNLYEIIDDEKDAQSERLMESVDLLNAIRLGNSFGNHMLFENRKALGTEHMHGLLHAIKNRLEVSFSYKKYEDGSVTQRKVQPVAIKEARNRWYLLAREPNGDIIKNFGLDRMADLEISSKKFKAITGFNPEDEFKYIFGIISGTGEKPEKVVLSFTPKEGRYINSLPLHHSQKELVKNEKERCFEYHLVPTYDFKMEILSYGDTVKVLEPKSLRRDIVAQLERALAGYK